MRFTPKITIAAILLAATAACGGDSSENAGDSTDQFRVALLTAGPVSDAGWYAGAYEGLLQIEAELGASISHQQTRSPAEYDEAFLAYGAEGYDLIFAHGSEYQDAAIRAGQQYPDTRIIVSGGGRTGVGVQPLIFTLERATYLAGMVAGGMTTSNIVGMVGGVATPPARGTFRAFEAGARAVNPNVQVLETFIGSWDDVAAAREAAVAQLRRGADVLIHNTDGASFGVFQAVRDAQADGSKRYAMGMNRDQNSIAPDVILGSAVIDIPESFMDVARRFVAGTLGDDPIFGGTGREWIRFVPNPELVSIIPAALLARVEEARAAIRAGTLQVPRIPFVEGESGG